MIKWCAALTVKQTVLRPDAVEIIKDNVALTLSEVGQAVKCFGAGKAKHMTEDSCLLHLPRVITNREILALVVRLYSSFTIVVTIYQTTFIIIIIIIKTLLIKRLPMKTLGAITIKID